MSWVSRCTRHMDRLLENGHDPAEFAETERVVQSLVTAHLRQIPADQRSGHEDKRREASSLQDEATSSCPSPTATSTSGGLLSRLSAAFSTPKSPLSPSSRSVSKSELAPSTSESVSPSNLYKAIFNVRVVFIGCIFCGSLL